MEVAVAYPGESAVVGTQVRLAPNLKRDAVELTGRVADPLLFRDAMLVLSDVVRSELYVSAQEIERRANDRVGARYEHTPARYLDTRQSAIWFLPRWYLFTE